MPVRDTVLFPHAVLPLTVGRESSIQLIESLGEERSIVVTAQLDPRLDAPKPDDLHNVGTLATVHKIVRMPNQSRFVFTEGVERVACCATSKPSRSWSPRSKPSKMRRLRRTSGVEALVRNVVGQFQQIVSESATLSDELRTIAGEHRRSEPAGGLCRLVAAVPDHRRQAATAGDCRAFRPGWSC